MKVSTRKALRTFVQVVTGLCVAVPIFLTTSGIPSDVGAGAALLTVATVTGKFMNLAEDELKDK
jgi:hypothetical protein